MSKKQVTVIDYGIGNIRSVIRALESCYAEVQLTSDHSLIISSEKVVLPGVGAFADGMIELKQRGLDEVLRQYAHTGKPLMGICLGMQLLMDYSEEFGLHDGLGLIRGGVKAIPDTTVDGHRHKIPHIGWNELLNNNGQNWDKTILNGICPFSSVYFVHSYVVVPDREETKLATSDYNGCEITSVIVENNVIGCQFHPEKSGAIGLSILNNFINL